MTRSNSEPGGRSRYQGSPTIGCVPPVTVSSPCPTGVRGSFRWLPLGTAVELA